MWVPTYNRIVQNKQQNMWVVTSPGFTLESSESTAKIGLNTLIKIIYDMHIHLVANYDSMCCAGRHACHAAVLKQTDPVLKQI